MKAKDDAHKVALEEMKAKEDKTVGDLKDEHETDRKKLMEELDTLRPLKVVVYFMSGAHVS